MTPAQQQLLLFGQGGKSQSSAPSVPLIVFSGGALMVSSDGKNIRIGV